MMEAVVEASVMRLRPILMTTGAMVLGVLPLAYATGAGAESRRQIGAVLVGGLSLGTVLTLFVVPVAYTLIAGKRKKIVTAAEADALTATSEESLGGPSVVTAPRAPHDRIQ